MKQQSVFNSLFLSHLPARGEAEAEADLHRSRAAGTIKRSINISRSARLAAVASAFLFAASCAPESGEPEAEEDASGNTQQALGAYNGNLNWLICDLKRPLAPSAEGTITAANYKAILNGFKTKLGCNAIRVYIDPNIADAMSSPYPLIYTTVLDYARSLGLAIYANPLGTGMHRSSPCCANNTNYRNWIINYDKKFVVRFLGPFNEPGIGSALSVSAAQDILTKVRSGAHVDVTLVGLDQIHLDDSLGTFNAHSSLRNHLNIVSSHNAEGDTSATRANWEALMRTAGAKRTWATENPRPWSFVDPATGNEIGVRAAFSAGVDGIVLYKAFANDPAGSTSPAGLIDATGCRTSKGAAMANASMLVTAPAKGTQWDNSLNGGLGGWGTVSCAQ